MAKQRLTAVNVYKWIMAHGVTIKRLFGIVPNLKGIPPHSRLGTYKSEAKHNQEGEDDQGLIDWYMRTGGDTNRKLTMYRLMASLCVNFTTVGRDKLPRAIKRLLSGSEMYHVMRFVAASIASTQAPTYLGPRAATLHRINLSKSRPNDVINVGETLGRSLVKLLSGSKKYKKVNAFKAKDLYFKIEKQGFAHPWIKYGNFSGRESWNFIENYLIEKKKELATMRNIISVGRHMEPVDDENFIYRKVEPGPNYAKNVATMEYLLNTLPLLPTPHLFYILQLVSDYIQEYTPLVKKSMPALDFHHRCRDTDLCTLFNIVNRAARSRIYTKTVDPTFDKCTCHAKCTGGTGMDEDLEEYFYSTTVPVTLSTNICPLDRTSLSVKPKTKEKPRPLLCIENPKRVACSMDGCRAQTNLRYYQLDIDEEGNFLYRHVFYASNSRPFSDPILTHNVASACTNYSGVCFSGSRKCLRTFIATVKSAKQQKGEVPPFTHLHKWFRCKGCTEKQDKVFDVGDHMGLREWIHERSCLEKLYKSIKAGKVTDVDEAAAHTCRGCVAASQCRHFLSGLMTRLKRVRGTRQEYYLAMDLAILERIRGALRKKMTYRTAVEITIF